MKREVDGRGKDCPKPVIMTKKKLDLMESGVLTTIVDNEIAKVNVSKLAASLGHEYKVDKISDEEFHIEIIKGESSEELVEVELGIEDFEDLTIVFASDTMGKGSDELGRILIRSLFYTIMEIKPLPKTIIFYNCGVNLTCEGSDVIEDLKAIEQEGVEIISCGTCLDFLGIAEKLEVGEISNMYTIYEKLKDSRNTVTIG